MPETKGLSLEQITQDFKVRSGQCDAETTHCSVNGGAPQISYEHVQRTEPREIQGNRPHADSDEWFLVGKERRSRDRADSSPH